MADIVVLGAGLGGTLMAFELGDQLRPGDRVTLIGQSESYQFVPSNPWVAIGWRERKDIEVNLAAVTKRKNIRLYTEGARAVRQSEKSVELETGESGPFYERFVLNRLDIQKPKQPEIDPVSHA